MKKLPLFIIVALSLLASLNACNSKDDDNNNLYSVYKEWADKNKNWLTEQQTRKNADGTPYYQTIVPAWNPAAYVLIHYFNDRSATADNLTPLSTSTIDTRYIVHYCNDVPLDSSYNMTANGPGIFRTQLDKVIPGWIIALETMHVGDTAEVIVPYELAYGASASSSTLPYSNLRFNVRLVDIPYYEKNPK